MCDFVQKSEKIIIQYYNSDKYIVYKNVYFFPLKIKIHCWKFFFKHVFEIMSDSVKSLCLHNISV